MVAQIFFALPNDSLVVTSSSSGGIVGNGIINNSSTPDGTVFEFLGGGGAQIELDDTGGSPDVFDDDQSGSHIITDGGGIVADGNAVESESIINLRALDINGNPVGPEITVFVFSQNGNFGDVWGFSTDLPLDAGTSYVKVSGSNAGSSNYDDYVPCFGEGTFIKTETGRVPVEHLKVGQRVWTLRNNWQPIRWISTMEVDATDAFAPVVFETGSIGNSDRLVLSQQHRLWVSNAAVEMFFGEDAALVAAKHLCGLPGVAIRTGGKIRYTHFMFDQHQIVRSNGVLSESFFLSEASMGPLEIAAKRELVALFPSLQMGFSAFGPAAAMPLDQHQARVLTNFLMKPDTTPKTATLVPLDSHAV